MGSRKRIKAESMKEARKNIPFAKLNNCPTSPRKMRLIANRVFRLFGTRDGWDKF